ncbi:MAG: hypothetical protein RLP02_17215 [Coleofasciculus sp. C2-GNP5-27]
MKMINVAPKAFWGLATLSAITTAWSVAIPSATAITISGTSVQDISTNDMGESATVFFGGNIEGKDTKGLLSKALSQVSDWETVTQLINNIEQQITEVTLDVQLNNTSYLSNLLSRKSEFQFDGIEKLIGANTKAINDESKLRIHPETGLVQWANLDKKMWGFQEDTVAVYLSAKKNNYLGGKRGRVTTVKTGIFSTDFSLKSPTPTIAIDKLRVRDQSINLTETKPREDFRDTGYTATSDTGYNVTVAPGGGKYLAEKDCKDCGFW